MIIDSHCHLDFADFEPDRQQVIQRARDKGVTTMILAGISQATWPRLQRICQTYDGLYPCYGLHPYFIDQHKEQHLEDLRGWLQRPGAIALGECGLDFYLPHLDRSRQLDFFLAQLDMAMEFNLPLVIHSRKANSQVLQAIQQRPGLTGMIHSFSGSIEVARAFIKQGFYISLGAVVTFEKAKKIRRLASQLPLEALLIETDAPDQPGLKHCKQRNEPAYILDTINVLAELRGQTREEIASATSQNALALFNLV